MMFMLLVCFDYLYYFGCVDWVVQLVVLVQVVIVLVQQVELYFLFDVFGYYGDVQCVGYCDDCCGQCQVVWIVLYVGNEIFVDFDFVYWYLVQVVEFGEVGVEVVQLYFYVGVVEFVQQCGGQYFVVDYCCFGQFQMQV